MAVDLVAVRARRERLLDLAGQDVTNAALLYAAGNTAADVPALVREVEDLRQQLAAGRAGCADEIQAHQLKVTATRIADDCCVQDIDIALSTAVQLLRAPKAAV